MSPRPVFFLNERAQDSANFIDKEEENSRLAEKKPLQVNAQSRQVLCACGEPKRKFFLYLKYKCSYRRLRAVEDPAIPLFPKFPTDEERKGVESFLWNVMSRRSDGPPAKWGRRRGAICWVKFGQA
jgi:hypothetical protein